MHTMAIFFIVLCFPLKKVALNSSHFLIKKIHYYMIKAKTSSYFIPINYSNSVPKIKLQINTIIFGLHHHVLYSIALKRKNWFYRFYQPRYQVLPVCLCVLMSVLDFILGFTSFWM